MEQEKEVREGEREREMSNAPLVLCLDILFCANIGCQYFTIRNKSKEKNGKKTKSELTFLLL
jgi:hypothetical protein